MGRLFFRTLALTSVVAVTAYMALDPVLPELDVAGWMGKSSSAPIEQPVTTTIATAPKVLQECVGDCSPSPSASVVAPVVTAIMPSATVIEPVTTPVFDASTAGAAAVAAAAVAAAQAEAPRPHREPVSAKLDQATSAPATDARPHAAAPVAPAKSSTSGQRSAAVDHGSLKDARPAPRLAPARQGREADWVGTTFGRGI